MMKQARISARFHGLACGLVALAACEAAGSTTPSAETPDVRLLESDGRGAVIEFIPRFDEPVKFTRDGHEFIRYGLLGGRLAEKPRPGAPELWMRPVLMRFHGMKDNSIEVMTADYDETPGVLLAPVPNRHAGDIDGISAYGMDAAAYARAQFLPGTIARLAYIGETRGAFLGEVQFLPLQYNPALRTLRTYKRIVVRVTFGAPETPAKPMAPVARLALNDRPGMPGTVRGRAALRNSILSSRNWFKFQIPEDGIYKLTGQTLLQAGIPSSVDPHTIRIFGNGGAELPMDLLAPAADDLLENAVYVSDGGNVGQLDASDYLLFYAMGVRGWAYDPVRKSFSHYINHYTESNTYWLSYGNGPAKQMPQVPSLNQSAPWIVSSVVGKLFREDEKENILSSGLQWLGQLFVPGGQIVYVHPLPGLDVNQPVTYKFFLAARATTPSQFTITEHGSTIATASLRSTDVGGDYDPQAQVALVTGAQVPSQVPGFTDGQSQLRFIYSALAAGANGFIDWYEIYYRRGLQAQADLFSFHAADTDAVARYDVAGFSGGPVSVFDVTRFDSVVMVANPTISADTCSFQVQLTSGTARQLYVVGPGGFKTPGALTPVGTQNLHGDTSQAAYIIISPTEFLPAARRLQTYRERPGANSLSAEVVDVNQVYNEFGGGLFTPVAIRNYLRYVYLNRISPPAYVLLLGGASFDYKNILGNSRTWIPAWESVESYYPLDTYSSDDEFVIFNLGARVNLGLGRCSAQSLDEANAFVDKVIEYETGSVEDPWKLRCTFVADDGPAGLGVNDGFIHTQDAEAVSGLVLPMFEKRKIYLYEYPTVYTAGGRRKPAVNAAIDDQINQGTLLLNFNGHGNPHVWTHESVFENAGDFPLLHNKGKYFFLVAATCNYSNFDNPEERSGGEILAGTQGAGAIGVFSATRQVFQQENRDLNLTLYQNIFETDSLGHLLRQRLGDIIYRTKQIHSSDVTNDLKYFLLGDPTLQLAFPALPASVDSINHAPATLVTQIKALEHLSIAATVRDTASGSALDISGQGQVVVFDATHQVTLTDPTLGSNNTMTYTAPGAVLFRGQATVDHGAIATGFIVPKDISYSDGPGRITVYFSNPSTDGAGYTTNILVNGTDSTAPPDTKGPTISIFFDSRSFRPGDVVSASPLLIADFSDSSGINTSDAGVGHRIEAWLDDQSQSLDLSGYYASKPNTYQQGTVQYPMGSLSEGTHKIRLRAWDTYNNSSEAQSIFNALSGSGLKITNVFNYPNPVSNSTVFTFDHNQIVALDAQVKIYTIAGRLIRSLEVSGIGSRFAQIPWDGRDQDGDQLANGVYLYKIIAKTLDGRFRDEALGKLSILR